MGPYKHTRNCTRTRYAGHLFDTSFPKGDFCGPHRVPLQTRGNRTIGYVQVDRLCIRWYHGDIWH